VARLLWQVPLPTLDGHWTYCGPPARISTSRANPVYVTESFSVGPARTALATARLTINITGT
jgi:hypothetical protein